MPKLNRPSPDGRGFARWRGALAALPLALAAAVLAGCSDGYPSEDLDQTSPFDMSNTQRLRALNAVAANAHRRERAQFELNAGEGSAGATGRAREARCRLTVRLHRDGSPVLTQHHSLRRGMDAVVIHNEALRSFEVHLVDGVGSNARRLGVLMRSASWTHATQVDLLVQLMIRDCAVNEPDAPARKERAGR